MIKENNKNMLIAPFLNYKSNNRNLVCKLWEFGINTKRYFPLKYILSFVLNYFCLIRP